MIAIRASAVAEEISEGFHTIALPKARAGAIFQAGMAIGIAQGLAGLAGDEQAEPVGVGHERAADAGKRIGAGLDAGGLDRSHGGAGGGDRLGDQRGVCFRAFDAQVVGDGGVALLERGAAGNGAAGDVVGEGDGLGHIILKRP